MEIYLGESPLTENPNQVYHNRSLRGKGTKESPLKVSVDGLNLVTDSDKLTGEGTALSPLAVIPDWTIRTESNLPLQTEGLEFITLSTSVQPGEIKKYVAYMLQNGNPEPPIASVLENTIGVIAFTYDAAGSYLINSSALFTEERTFISITGHTALNAEWLNSSSLSITNPLGAEIDGYFFLEIRVYPAPLI